MRSAFPIVQAVFRNTSGAFAVNTTKVIDRRSKDSTLLTSNFSFFPHSHRFTAARLPSGAISRHNQSPAMASATDGIAEEQMLKKGQLIMQKLAEVYPKAPKGFLDHTDAFTLLIAVLLSAQTQDTKVNEVTPELFRQASNPKEMRDLGEGAIKTIIKSIGLSPQKAKNITKLSGVLCDEHGGQVPDTFEDLEKLPGVGHKTASVVMIQAFKKPAFPVDTHIHRLACRWGCGHHKSVEKTEEALKKWFPDPNSWGDLHTRIILFGREYCPARNHDMYACPVCSFAATDEALAANTENQKKFVAPQSHANPYIIREVDTDIPAKPVAEKIMKSNTKPALNGKRTKVSALKTKRAGRKTAERAAKKEMGRDAEDSSGEGDTTLPHRRTPSKRRVTQPAKYIEDSDDPEDNADDEDFVQEPKAKRQPNLTRGKAKKAVRDAGKKSPKGSSTRGRSAASKVVNVQDEVEAEEREGAGDEHEETQHNIDLTKKPAGRTRKTAQASKTSPNIRQSKRTLANASTANGDKDTHAEPEKLVQVTRSRRRMAADGQREPASPKRQRKSKPRS